MKDFTTVDIYLILKNCFAQKILKIMNLCATDNTSEIC